MEAQTLSQLLGKTFHDIKFHFVFNYLDLLVYSKISDEHIGHLEDIFGRL